MSTSKINTRERHVSETVSPLYAQIVAKLRDRITTGQYPISSVMPTEAELSHEFETSRHTVREALRRLSEQGFVRTRQGAGTIIVSSEPHTTYAQSFRSLSDLFQNAVDTFFVVHSITPVVLGAELAKRIDVAPGQVWLDVAGVRWTEPGGSPIAYVHSYVPGEFKEIVATFPHQERMPFYGILEEKTGRTIEHVHQEICATTMPSEVAHSFGLKEGSMAIQLLRRYVTRNGILIASFNWHRADQFVYKMQIDRRITPER